MRPRSERFRFDGSFRWHGGEGAPDVGPEAEWFRSAGRQTAPASRNWMIPQRDALSKFLLDPVKGGNVETLVRMPTKSCQTPCGCLAGADSSRATRKGSARSLERRSATSPIPRANSPRSRATPTTTRLFLSLAMEKRSRPCSVRRARTFFCFRRRASREIRRSPPAAQNRNSFVFGWQNDGDASLRRRGESVRIAADGSGRTTLLSVPDNQILRPTRCPGTRFVTFVRTGSQGNGQVNVWRANDDGTNPTQLTTSGSMSHLSVHPTGNGCITTIMPKLRASCAPLSRAARRKRCRER